MVTASMDLCLARLGEGSAAVAVLCRWDMPVIDVEKIKAHFDTFDEDGSGIIEFGEFRLLLFKLLKVKDPSEARCLPCRHLKLPLAEGY